MKKNSVFARVIAIALCFLLLQYGVIAHAGWDLPFDGCVTADKVSVYQDSDTNSERLTRLDSDTVVTVIGVEQYGNRTWYKVLFDGNRRGYIDAKYVERQTVTLAYNTLLELVPIVPTALTARIVQVRITLIVHTRRTEMSHRAPRLRRARPLPLFLFLL